MCLLYYFYEHFMFKTTHMDMMNDLVSLLNLLYHIIGIIIHASINA